MIETGTGKVGGLTGARKFRGYSVSFRTASVAAKNSQRYETLEASGLQQSQRICCEPTSLTRTDNSMRAYDYEAPICKEDGTANFAAFSYGRTLFRPAYFLTRRCC